MQSIITWTLGSSAADAESSLAQIAQWWAGLSGQTITWQQRPLPESGDVSAIDWNTQKFDESFAIQSSELRGITLYWHKPLAEEERNITVRHLELDLYNQRLDLLPESGRNYQIRVTLPKIVYQTVKLSEPQFGCMAQPNGDRVFLFRDEAQRLEVQISLSAANFETFKQKLS